MNNMGETNGNDTRKIQNHNKTHILVRFHHMVSTSIGHEHQQTTDNTKHRTQNSSWVNNIHQHTTSTRRNADNTHKITPPTTRIPDKTKSQHPTHLLHYITSQQTTPRRKKQTTFNSTDYSTNILTQLQHHKQRTNQNKHETHTHHHSQTYFKNRIHNKVTNTIPLNVHHSEMTTLPCATCGTLAQLKTNKCPTPHSYLNRIYEQKLTPIITTMSHLQNRNTHYNTLVQLHQKQGHGFVDGSRESGEYDGRMEGLPVSQRAWMPTRCGDIINQHA